MSTDDDRAPYEGSAYEVISTMPLGRALTRLTANDRPTVRPGAPRALAAVEIPPLSGPSVFLAAASVGVAFGSLCALVLR